MLKLILLGNPGSLLSIENVATCSIQIMTNLRKLLNIQLVSCVKYFTTCTGSENTFCEETIFTSCFEKQVLHSMARISTVKCCSFFQSEHKLKVHVQYCCRRENRNQVLFLIDVPET